MYYVILYRNFCDSIEGENTVVVLSEKRSKRKWLD